MGKKSETKLRPVSIKTSEIVEGLARKKVVETLIRNVTHHSTIRDNLQDLVQIIYLALLETDPSKLEHLVSAGQIKFYIVRIIKNQYYSQSSPFFNEIRRFGRSSVQVSNQLSESYYTEKIL